MRGTGRALAVVSAAAVIAAATAGCSSSKSGGSSTTGSTSVASPSSNSSSAPTGLSSSTGSSSSIASTPSTGKTPSGQPIRIGELTPTSGPGFNYPDWLAGATAAARAINKAGGIDGRPVQIDECDDRNDPNQATTCARKMVSDKVIAVAGGATFFGTAMVPILKQGNIAWVGDIPQTEPEYNETNMFHLDSGNIQNGAGPVAALKAAGVTKIFAAHLAVAQGDAIFTLVKSAAKAEGIQVVGDASFPLATTDMSSIVQQAINSGSNGVTFGGTQQQQVAFFKTARQLGAKFTIGVVDGSLTVAQYKEIGNIKVVVDGNVPPVSAGTSYADKYPGVTEFVKDMTAEFKAGNKFADPAKTSLHAMIAWLSVKMIAKVAATVTTIDAKSVLAAFSTATNLVSGVIPPWTPSAAGPSSYPRISNPKIWLSKIDSNGVAQLSQPDPIDMSEVGIK